MGKTNNVLADFKIVMLLHVQKEIPTLVILTHCCCILCVARFEWLPDDPEIVSDVLFAVANVMSIARTTYLMPAFEVLGPLQISLGRMLGDITRFLVLYTLVRWGIACLFHSIDL